MGWARARCCGGVDRVLIQNAAADWLVSTHSRHKELFRFLSDCWRAMLCGRERTSSSTTLVIGLIWQASELYSITIGNKQSGTSGSSIFILQLAASFIQCYVVGGEETSLSLKLTLPPVVIGELLHNC